MEQDVNLSRLKIDGWILSQPCQRLQISQISWFKTKTSTTIKKKKASKQTHSENCHTESRKHILMQISEERCWWRQQMTEMYKVNSPWGQQTHRQHTAWLRKGTTLHQANPAEVFLRAAGLAFLQASLPLSSPTARGLRKQEGKLWLLCLAAWWTPAGPSLRLAWWQRKPSATADAWGGGQGERDACSKHLEESIVVTAAPGSPKWTK